MDYILRTFGLSKKYKKQMAVDHVNMHINQGDIYGFVGENGSGKTTLVRTLLSLQPSLSGEIKFDSSLKGKIGYLPQQTETQRDFPASVKEIVLSGFLGKKKVNAFYSFKEKKEVSTLILPSSIHEGSILIFENKC